MKKIVVLTVCLILMISLWGCGSAKTVPEKAPEKAPAAAAQSPASTPANNTNIKISITPPSGWQPVAGSVLPVQYLKNTASFMVKKETFSGKTLDDVVKEAKEAFSKAFENVSYIGEPEAITVDGREAKKLVFTCTISKMPMKYEYVYLLVEGKVYAITFGDLGQTFDSLKADYGQILKDIHFTKA